MMFSLCPHCGSPHTGPCPREANYNEQLAAATARKYGKRHVVPLTGGGDDPFIYWTTDERGMVGLIRGSYTRKPLESEGAA